MVRFAALWNDEKQENQMKRGDAVMSLGDNNIWYVSRHWGNAEKNENQIKRGDAVMSLGDNYIWYVSRHWGTLKSEKSN